MVATGTLQAPEELTVQQVRDFGTGLLASLRTGSPLGVDLSRVQHLDTAGVQLLVLARREAERAGLPLDFMRPAPIVVETLQFCGLAGVLEASAQP